MKSKCVVLCLRCRARILSGMGQERSSHDARRCYYIPLWHGVAPDSWFSHLAVEVPGENSSNEWCEPVLDEVYTKL